MKLNNLFHIAFVSVLLGCFLHGFNWPAIIGLLGISTIIAFHDYLDFKRNKEEVNPLNKRMDDLYKKLEKTENDFNTRVTKVENSNKMNLFQAKKI